MSTYHVTINGKPVCEVGYILNLYRPDLSQIAKRRRFDDSSFCSYCDKTAANNAAQVLRNTLPSRYTVAMVVGECPVYDEHRMYTDKENADRG